jgi:hypothetical protein
MKIGIHAERATLICKPGTSSLVHRGDDVTRSEFFNVIGTPIFEAKFLQTITTLIYINAHKQVP